ncbi:hypothetical protein OS493_039273, partial [Desmophyllum pertusum]
MSIINSIYRGIRGWAWSLLVHGVVEQQYVFHVMDHALCLSESKQKSCDKHVTRGGKPKPSGAYSLSLPSM